MRQVPPGILFGSGTSNNNEDQIQMIQELKQQQQAKELTIKELRSQLAYIEAMSTVKDGAITRLRSRLAYTEVGGLRLGMNPGMYGLL